MKKFLKYFWIDDIIKEVRGYGYTYSMKSYLSAIAGILIAVIGIGIFYELWIGCIVAIIIASVLCFTSVIRSQFIFRYNAKRFDDVDVYLHQMLYSFQRYAKIDVALEDVARISEGTLNDTVMKALKHLSEDWSSSAIENALKVVEQEYDCDKVKVLHKFLLSVYNRGGKYQTSLIGLLSDFDRWVLRVYRKQQELKKLRFDTGIGIIITAVVGSMSVLVTKIMSTSDIGMDISGEMAYQISSVLFFILCIIYYAVVENKFTGQWLVNARSDAEIKKDYKDYFKPKSNSDRVVSFIISGVIFLIGALICVLPLQSFGITGILNIAFKFFGAVVMVIAIVALRIPSSGNHAAKKRLEKDIYECFPEWLRDVSINMQYSPIERAIEDTYETCPVVLKPSLKKFINDINNNPNNVEPYYEFLQEFGIMDVSAAMKSLYSFNELTREEVETAINSLIDRIYNIIEKKEEMREKDEISVMGLTQMVPSLLLGVKIAVDMMLIVIKYIG